ncbi:DUF4397 domain-containing protein [Mucilaginibacter sp.]|uniref:DUF4397 domain-containing protein n=1 Tax=Mucilaginibacter sp. TaxID=1882438 RepID=UPI002618F4DA|nr:DUF4397 domain-containing protein [Mucilaginibacter sp.]MDB4919970.1 hypothetical protein [Mucilaginibacter sp.]
MNTRLTFFVFIAALAGLISCKNNDNVFPPVNTDGRFKIINASSNTINFFLNGTRLNNGSSLVPGGSILYIAAPLGLQNFQFKKDGSPDILFSWPDTLKNGINYSLYITGNTARQAFRTTEVLNPDSNLVSLGFVNAAPDAGSLDVTVGDTIRFTASAFKTQSKFLLVGNGLRDVKVYKAGTKTMLKDTSFNMDQNHVYTIFSHGLLNGTGSSKFNVGYTLNY